MDLEALPRHIISDKELTRKKSLFLTIKASMPEPLFKFNAVIRVLRSYHPISLENLKIFQGNSMNT